MPVKVYFLPVSDGLAPSEQAQAMRKLFEASDAAHRFESDELIAVKLHVGEKHNDTHIKPELIKEVVVQIQRRKALPFLTETPTLYKGERENAVKHLIHAQRHGFGFDGVGAPFIMADGLNGTAEHEVVIDGELHHSVKIAREVATADGMVVVSHPTGHIAAGLGACIKNLGMGLASRMGKMRQHSAMKPKVVADACRYCQKCKKWCPQAAIVERDGKAFILTEKCIGCGECLAMCRFDSIEYDWNAESGFLQKSMAEHAFGVVKDKLDKVVFVNVLIDMTKDCDCFNVKQEKLIPDIGLLLLFDPVAIDKATMDLTQQAHGKTLAELAYRRHDAMIQIEHAAKVGMGSLDYELIKISS